MAKQNDDDQKVNATVNTLIGTHQDDVLDTQSGETPDQDADNADPNTTTNVDKINGNAGSDIITSGKGNDLAAGDMVGNEWSFVNDKWVYDPSKIVHVDASKLPAYNDVIKAGDGDDVVLGNGGNDQLWAGTGDDIVNAGDGNDKVYGGTGDDLLNLEDGDDRAEGGAGDDVINAGAGDDIVYGDNANENLLSEGSYGQNLTSFSQYAASGAWTVTEEDGQSAMTQSIDTVAGETYTISFELAANLSGGATHGCVEVLWNGEVVTTVGTESGVYKTHTIEVSGTGGEGALTFREVAPPAPEGPEIDMSGPIFSYEAQKTIGGEEVNVAAFAPGQSKLYQVMNGQLKVFDTQENAYVDAGDPTGIRLNAIGFNVEDDLIYGVAKSSGTDALGNKVSSLDLMMIDADGSAYRVGKAPYGDYVGDFDDSGNLWTFHTSLDRVSKIDVDHLDANGNPTITNYDLPNSFFKGRAYDIAYNAADNAFYVVEPPSSHNGAGAVHRVDLSEIDSGGSPQITSIPVTGTLVDGEMQNGMAKGAYGAVFLDGDGNLYYGLNRGDHDHDMETGVTGAIYKVHMDWTVGAAYSELMSEAQAVSSNDGAVDPRSADAFTKVDTDAPFLIRNPEIAPSSGGNDDLRGGEGNDIMYGGGGDDILHGGNDDDMLSGDAGNDRVYGGAGDDELHGGSGDDKITGGQGNDVATGGTGKDYIHTGDGDDRISGGDGVDKLVGGKGADIIEGGAGNDHMWGGNWWKDGASDTFVVSAGSGKDIIHDFEVGTDQIDLSSYGLEFSDLQKLITDKGWAAEIDLSGLEGAGQDDKLIIKSVDADKLDESSFIL